MSKKLFSEHANEVISPLIDVIMNAFGVMFIFLIIYLAAARPAKESTPLKFLSGFTPPPAIPGQSYLFTLPIIGGIGERHFKIQSGSFNQWSLQFDEESGTIYGIPRWPPELNGLDPQRILKADFVFEVTDSAGGSDTS